jgi:hypothetical protein
MSKCMVTRLRPILGLIARSGLFTNCMGKASEWVATCFGLPGKMNSTEVKELVAWLLKDGHYEYGEVDTQVQSFILFLSFSLFVSGQNIQH